MQAGSGTVPGPGVLHPCADDPMLLLLLAGPPGGRRPCRVEQRQCGLELSDIDPHLPAGHIDKQHYTQMGKLFRLTDIDPHLPPGHKDK